MRMVFLLFILGKFLLVQFNVSSRITFAGLLLPLFIITILFLLPFFSGFNKRELHIGYIITSIILGVILLICSVYERYAFSVISSLLEQVDRVNYSIYSFFQFKDILFIMDIIFLAYFLLSKPYKLKNKRNLKEALFKKEWKVIDLLTNSRIFIDSNKKTLI
jgi:hypothetical protein